MSPKTNKVISVNSQRPIFINKSLALKPSIYTKGFLYWQDVVKLRLSCYNF